MMENLIDNKIEKKRKYREEIFKLVDAYFKLNKIDEKGKEIKTFPLVVSPFGSEEVKEAIDSLLSTYVTMGTKCKQFEDDFSKYIGMKYGLFVNSGSSANLIALSILSSPFIDDPIKTGDEVITSAVTWSTTIFPIYNIGATPVFVDIDPETMVMDVDQIESVISPKTKAIMPVHLLGNPCNMEKIMEIAQEHNLYVIEDCCEAHGAKIGDKMVGSFGHLSTFSFFFSHHISTIEGGMVLTNNNNFNNIGKSLRAHGWIRERNDKEEIINKYSDVDSRFLFIHSGYNLRPTEIQGAFGIHQLPKLDGFISKRTFAAKYLEKKLRKYEKYLILPKIFDNCQQSWFGFAIIVRETAPFTRKEFSNFLEEHGIETRPIMGGNFIKQPVMKFLQYRTSNELPNSQLIYTNGIFLGLNHKITEIYLDGITEIFNQFFKFIKK